MLTAKFGCDQPVGNLHFAQLKARRKQKAERQNPEEKTWKTKVDVRAVRIYTRFLYRPRPRVTLWRPVAGDFPSNGF